jgi:hypothetical protein
MSNSQLEECVYTNKYCTHPIQNEKPLLPISVAAA